MGKWHPKLMIKSALGHYGFQLQRAANPISGTTGLDASVNEDSPSGSDLWYRSGTWRYSIPVDLAVGRPCFSYAKDGWHPYVATIMEAAAGSATMYSGSVLKRFYDIFTPETIGDAYFPERPVDERRSEAAWRLPATTLFDPWFVRKPPLDNPWKSKVTASGSRLFGPVSETVGQEAYSRIMRIRDSIARAGYSPGEFRRGWIEVIVLQHHGDVRYLVVHGQHRMAALSASGVRSVRVAIRSGMPSVIDSEDVERWPYVRSGQISSAAAVEQLGRYFHSDGTFVRDLIR